MQKIMMALWNPILKNDNVLMTEQQTVSFPTRDNIQLFKKHAPKVYLLVI